MPQPNSAGQIQYIGDNSQGHRGQPNRSNPAHNGLLSDPLFTTPTQPFSSNIYRPLGSSGVIEPNTGVNEHLDLSTRSSLAQHPSWTGGGVQSVSQPENSVFQFTASGTPAASLPEPPPMRYLHTDLPVLNVEQYEEGPYSKRPSSKVNPKPNVTAVQADSAPNPRKRGRKPVDHDRPKEANEETKRTRGRPRLETKDQTPTERRRTQIRLAQRAHRNRKEKAIKDLQARLDDLKDVTNEINSAYQNLFDYASQRGLLSQAPEFGQQLQRLQSLIKQTHEDDSKLSDQESPEGNSDDNIRDAQGPEDNAVLNEELVPSTLPTSLPTLPTTLAESQPLNLWGGYQVSHGPVIQQESSASTSDFDPTLINPQLHQHQYEIVTAPTPNNASFGTHLSVDMNFANPEFTNWATHPYNRLTGPRTMAFHEWAFARRLHRHCVERASALIHMSNPPPTVISRVFGFVMLFETVDEIRHRMTATLNRIRDQPLNYWEHPFHRLGGSGTHFSDPEYSSLSGSSNYQSTGFATGPFNERVTRVRDTMLGVSQYINMSGWEGTWFDSGEVETYLAQNGIVIPIAADLHAVEVPPNAFSDVQADHQIQLMQSIPPNAAPMLPENQTFAPEGSDNNLPPTGLHTFSAGPDISNAGPSTSQGDPWPHVSVTSSLHPASHPADGGIPTYNVFDNMTNALSNPSSYIFPHHEPELPVAPPAPKRVVMDVNKFISDLISHATCLGRAPAFRPKDIASAFWGAIISD